MFIWNSNLLQVHPLMGPFLLKRQFKKQQAIWVSLKQEHMILTVKNRRL